MCYNIPTMSRRKRDSASFDPVLSRGIIAIFLIMVALVIGLSFFGRAGTLGVVIDGYILSFLFGQIRYVVPIILAVIAFFLVKDIEYDYRATHGIGAILFFVVTASLFHLHFTPRAMWDEALLGHGGGVFGMGAFFLKEYLDTIASLIILVSLLIVSILLMFNTAIVHLIMMNKKILGQLGVLGRALVATTKAVFVLPPAADTSIEEVEADDEEREDGEDEAVKTGNCLTVR